MLGLKTITSVEFATHERELSKATEASGRGVVLKFLIISSLDDSVVSEGITMHGSSVNLIGWNVSWAGIGVQRLCYKSVTRIGE